MNKPDFVVIKDGDKVVKELAVFFDPRRLCSSEYAIVLNPNHYLMISRERFNRIINKAREKGYDVFDYTDF